MSEDALKIHKADAPLVEPERESSAHKFLADAYQWASDNKASVALGAVALAAIGGGGALLKRALSSSEAGLADLAISDASTNLSGATTSLLPRDLSFKPNPNLSSFNFPVVEHELSSSRAWTARYHRELGEDDYFPDGSIKMLRYMANEPETAHIFSEASARMTEGGHSPDEWGRILTETFEQRSPQHLGSIKYGLSQIGMLDK